jgi:integral membrane protein (TIGR01906 family)
VRRAGRLTAPWVFAAALVTALLLSAFLLPALSINFYEAEFDKLNVYEAANVHKDEVMRVTRHMIGYLSGKNADLQILAALGHNTPPPLSASRVPFFSGRAAEHMKDVKNLFTAAIITRGACFAAVLIIGVIAAGGRLSAAKLAAAVLVVSGVFTAFGAAAALLAASDFSGAFTVFHKLFFTNDLWLLSADDRLLNIVPEQFFIDAAARAALTFGGLLAAANGAAAGFLIFSRRARKS